MDRIRVLITGRVQGVGFRAWAVKQAQKLEVRGWIRNRADGAVEAEIAGDPDAVSRMRDLLAQGPPLAHVDRLIDEQPGIETLPDEFQTVW
ncbi:MAG: acylphosphatase [Longimicrobiales bacterium]